MSFGSPAKLERIERHLSRQRGAGVRSLATSFGFSLGLPAVTVLQDASSEGPVAKRRKLSKAGDDEVIPTAATKEQGGEKAEAELGKDCGQDATTTTKPKVRRQFDVVNDEPKAASQQHNLDDSFTKTAKKRGRPKKAETALKSAPVKVIKKPAKARTARKIKEDVPEDTHDMEKPTEVRVEQPVRRPRRQAATSAMAKVAEGFFEEAEPIDKKRREPEPEKVVKRGRKKTVPVIAAQEVVVDTMDNQEAALCDRSHKTTDERPAKRSRKVAAIVEPVEPVEPVTSKSANAEAGEIKPVAPTEMRDSRKVDRSTASSKVAARIRVKEGTGTKLEPAEVEQEAKIKKQRRSAKVEASLPKLVPDSTSHKSGRKPLGETHANTAMRSTSPEKMLKSPAKHEDEVKEYVSIPKSRGPSPAKAHAVLDMPVKKRKAAKPFTDPLPLQGIAVGKEEFGGKTKAGSGDGREHDERLAKEAPSEGVKMLTKPSRPKSARAVATLKPPASGPKVEPLDVLPAQEPTNLQPPTEEKPTKATTSKTRSRAPQPPAETDDGDNVDWLFTAPVGDTKQPRSQKSKKQKIAAKAPGSRSKMAINEDMDLDDLLTNIATFAGAMTTGKSQKSTRRAL